MGGLMFGRFMSEFVPGRSTFIKTPWTSTFIKNRLRQEEKIVSNTSYSIRKPPGGGQIFPIFYVSGVSIAPITAGAMIFNFGLSARAAHAKKLNDSMARLSCPTVRTQALAHVLYPLLPPFFQAFVAHIDQTPLNPALLQAAAADIAPLALDADPVEHTPLLQSLRGIPRVAIAFPEHD
ncbi:hypothetical protein BDV93DRAFT_505626 [Ceratobasidium sp. AG-I]|nr:hypothetical protein BDV93DRAFT_505626 [Ceratobasidium sp. AG-I]